MDTNDFIKEAKIVHGDKYDYSKVNYVNSTTKVIIICPIHGEFLQRPGDHLNKKCGCNLCRLTKSKDFLPIKGKRKMREYSIWKNIKSRVSNSNLSCSNRYIDRNITCCDRWLESFEAFYNDMGPCPDGYSIDRIDNNKGYFPENCRWTDSKTQAQNRGDFNKLFTYNGETHVLKEWARILGIKYTTLYLRIYRTGLSFEDAIKKDPFNRQILINNESHTLKEWSEIYRIKYQTVVNRIHRNWDVIKALTTPHK